MQLLFYYDVRIYMVPVVEIKVVHCPIQMEKCLVGRYEEVLDLRIGEKPLSESYSFLKIGLLYGMAYLHPIWMPSKDISEDVLHS